MKHYNNMSYPYNNYYPQPPIVQKHHQDPKIAKLKQDNLQLEKALAELNKCYQQKISILESQLKKKSQREQQLLEWKSQYIQKQLFSNQKYQDELQKMIKMMEEMASNYQQESLENKTEINSLKSQLLERQQQICHLKDQNNYLRNQRDNQDQKIQTLAKKYIDQIQRLNKQLKDLKDQIIDQDIIEQNDFSVEDQEETQKDQNLHYEGNNGHQESEQGQGYGTESNLSASTKVNVINFVSNQKLIVDLSSYKENEVHSALKDISNQDSSKNVSAQTLNLKLTPFSPGSPLNSSFTS